MTKSELKRKLMTQRIEAVVGIDRKEIELNAINYDFPMEYSDLKKLERRALLQQKNAPTNEEIFTTELLKQDDVKLH